MDLDTATLRALHVLAEELHFGRAASRLGISQQAMSKRIQRLESLVGAALVDRTDRRVLRLTPSGRQLLQPAREVLDAVDRLPSWGGRTRRLTIDVMDENAAPMAWTRRAARSSDAPAVDVVQRAPEQSADALVLNGRAQLAFGRAGSVGIPWPAEVHRRLVLLEPLSVLLPSGHPWAELTEIELAELRGHSWWFPMSDAPYEWRELAGELSAVAGVTLDTTGSTFGFAQWAADVTAGLAPPSLIGEEMSTPPGLAVTTVPIVAPTPVYPWWVLWRDLESQTVDTLLNAMGLGGPTPVPGSDVWLPRSDAELLSAGQRPPASLRLR